MDEQINRYMIIIIGNSKGIEKDLNNILNHDIILQIYNVHLNHFPKIKYNSTYLFNVVGS